MVKFIGIHEPHFIGNEKKYLANCISSNWVSNRGKYLKLLERKIKKITNSKYVIPVLNGTIGLHISLILSNVNKDSEVIVPTISFVSPINAVRYLGASPIFMDVDDYYNIDQEKCINFIKNKTFLKNGRSYNSKTKREIKALIVVHCFGNAANFEKLFNLCKKRNIKIIEDAAESLGSIYTKGEFLNKHTGTIGHLGVISFNGNKITTAGNGGVILTQKLSIYKKCRYIINQSKDDPIRFIHNSIGYNYSLSNLSASVVVAQIENLNFFLKKKREINEYYKKAFSKIPGLRISEGPSYSKNNYWLNLLIGKKNWKKRLFRNGKIQLRPIWYPNHLQKPFKRFQKFKVNHAQNVYKKVLCLPSSTSLSKKDIKRVVNFINHNQ